jgi:hypothetical protein
MQSSVILYYFPFFLNGIFKRATFFGSDPSSNRLLVEKENDDAAVFQKYGERKLILGGNDVKSGCDDVYFKKEDSLMR